MVRHSQCSRVSERRGEGGGGGGGEIQVYRTQQLASPCIGVIRLLNY